MRILLVCAGGFTTSLMVENTKEVLQPGDYVNALPVSEVKTVIDDYDVVLLGPQVKYKLKEVSELAKKHGKKAGVLEPRVVSTLSGQAIYQAAKKLMEE